MSSLSSWEIKFVYIGDNQWDLKWFWLYPEILEDLFLSVSFLFKPRGINKTLLIQRLEDRDQEVGDRSHALIQ